METIPDFHNTPVRLNRISELKDDACCRPSTLKRCEDCVKENKYISANISKTSKIINALEFGVLPMRVSHNDPKLNNVLFDKDTKEVMCLIDLDTIMPGSVLYDFGDACRFSCNEQSEEPEMLKKRWDKAEMLMENFLSEVSFNFERYEKINCFSLFGTIYTYAYINVTFSFGVYPLIKINCTSVVTIYP